MTSEPTIVTSNGLSTAPPLGDDAEKPAPALVAADAPISTTKALLLSIVVPRVHRLYVAGDNDGGERGANDAKEKGESRTSATRGSSHGESNKADHTEADTCRDKNLSGDADIDPKNGEVKKEDDAKCEEDDVGYVEGEDEEEPVEHVVTPEEMAHVVKIQEPPTDEDASTENDGVVAEEAPPVETPLEKVKTFFGVVTKKEEEEGDVTGTTTICLTKEESVAALKHSESSRDSDKVPNTEIRVEALLKLTFKGLLEEGHLFNAPSYATVKKDENIDSNEWIQLSVMIKASSIGTALERLERIGVGSSVGTVCVYRAELLKTAYDFSSPSLRKKVRKGSSMYDNDDSDSDDESASDADKERLKAAKAEWKNAASRLRVEQVKEQIHESASLSLDFLALLGIASILAGIGLITDSTVVIVASMLVSPIMGPVMGMTFGSRVCDWKLAKWSAANELTSLLLAVSIGACIALTSSWTESASEWPTNEMISRGETTGLLTGIAIAIPSGMGVALSIIGNNTSSLVGVAISASLLPPAVNAGICWFHAILLKTGAATRYNHEDFAHIGSISFALTVVNIVCIWVAGIAMFKIKEVAPTKAKSAFWSRDIKIARNVNKGGGSKSKKVDTEVIREGLKEALKREQQMKNEVGPADTATLRWRKKRAVRKAAGPRSGVTFNLAVNPVPMENINHMNEGSAKAVGLDDLVKPFPIRGVPGNNGVRTVPIGASAVGTAPPLGASVAESKTPLTDDVRYVGLEDMAALLGFEDEDEDGVEDVEPSRNRWGLGWFR